MKARTATLTAVALLALAASAAQAQIPPDPQGVRPATPHITTLAMKLTQNPFAARTAKQTTGWRD